MRTALLLALLVAGCGGPTAKTLFGSPNPARCADGEESGLVAPGATVEVFAFELEAGEKVVVEFESERPGELVAGLAGPYASKEKATFAVETISEFPSDEIGSNGQTVTHPPRIELTVQRDGRYGIVVSSTADAGDVPWSACATVVRAESADAQQKE